MPSFLKNSQQILSSEVENSSEENYEKSFPKIARDFATREEVKIIIMTLVQMLSEYDQELGTRFSSLDLFSSGLEITKNKNLEYSENLKKPNSKKIKYEDLK